MAINGALSKRKLRDIPFAVKVRDHSSLPAYIPQLSKAATASLVRLADAFEREFGYKPKVNSGYRPLSVQRLFYANRGKTNWPATAAYPGTSVHGWGLAVDFGGLGGFGSDQYKWLARNAGRYGWFQPAEYQAGGRWPEYWHWEYNQAKDRYRRRKLKVTGTLNKATVRAIGRAVEKPVVTGNPTKAFWKRVQRQVNRIMRGSKGWTPLKRDGSPGPRTWEGIRLSLRKVNKNPLNRPGKNASKTKIIRAWQKALNAGKRNGWSQKQSRYYTAENV